MQNEHPPRLNRPAANRLTPADAQQFGAGRHRSRLFFHERIPGRGRPTAAPAKGANPRRAHQPARAGGGGAGIAADPGLASQLRADDTVRRSQRAGLAQQAFENISGRVSVLPQTDHTKVAVAALREMIAGGRVDRTGSEFDTIYLDNLWPDLAVDTELSLTDRLHNRIYEEKELPAEEAPRLTTDH